MNWSQGHSDSNYSVLFINAILFNVVLKKTKELFCIHAVKEYGVTGDMSSLIHILSSDKLSGKFQAAAAVSLEKEPLVLV